MLKIREKRARHGYSKSNQHPEAVCRRDGQSPVGDQRLTQSSGAPGRLLSSKHLDLLVLTVCSCLLTLLCHPSPSLLPSASATSSATAPAAPSTPPIDFYIKSVLMSSYQDQRQSGRERNA